MKDDELIAALKTVEQVKQNTDILLKEVDKTRKTSFMYKGEKITVEYGYSMDNPGLIFSTEKNKNKLGIDYSSNGLTCFHSEWTTQDFCKKFNPDEMKKALQFGFEKIMFPDCSNRTFENSQVITYKEMAECGLLDTNPDIETEEFWWFMPKDKSYSYIGDWDDGNPVLGNVYKIFSGVGNGFGDGAPYIGKFVREHPCCQTSLAVIYGAEESKEESFYVLPLHKLDSNDLKNLKDVISLVSKAPIKSGGSRKEYVGKEYVGEFWSCGPNERPGGSGVFLYERKGKKEVILTNAEDTENVEGFKRFQSSVWDLEY